MLRNLKAVLPAITAFGCLFFFGSLDQAPATQANATAASDCAKGYIISLEELHKFMIDSLAGTQFEGGIYSRADLISILQDIPGDSVYIMNVLNNCQLAQGTDLAITSKATINVRFARKKKCIGCPGKACCGRGVCAVNINRLCVPYTDYTPFAAEAPAQETYSSKGD